MAALHAKFPCGRGDHAALWTMEFNRTAAFYAKVSFLRIFKLAFWAFHTQSLSYIPEGKNIVKGRDLRSGSGARVHPSWRVATNVRLFAPTGSAGLFWLESKGQQISLNRDVVFGHIRLLLQEQSHQLS
jgi:hypothetical protein